MGNHEKAALHTKKSYTHSGDSSSLAAMGPANMIKSFATYIFQSLQVATLSLVASHLRENQKDTAARTLSTALVLAATFGLLTTIFLSVSHRTSW